MYAGLFVKYIRDLNERGPTLIRKVSSFIHSAMLSRSIYIPSCLLVSIFPLPNNLFCIVQEFVKCVFVNKQLIGL